MPNKITIPKFHTESAEAAWWDTHPEVATEIMKRALTSGKTKPAVPLKTVIKAARKPARDSDF